MWVRSHIGISGNETANRFAAEGATNNEIKLDLKELKTQIKMLH
jgi:ribonuclease HI